MLGGHDLLTAYCALIRRIVGAESVSVYVPAIPSADWPAILLHEGDGPPLPELADTTVAREFVAATGAEPPPRRASLVTESESLARGGKILRISAGTANWLDLFDPAETAPAQRRADHYDLLHEVWLGLRFADDRAAARLRDDRPEWWLPLVGLAAGFAGHVQAVAPVLLDPVTGLPGRAGFQAELHRVFLDTADERRGVALLLVNPDDFAVVNEQFGRCAGDRALREVARRLASVVRRSDPIARYGSAILACLLPDTDTEAARLLAEKIAEQLEEGAYLDGALRLGFSIGVAILDRSRDGSASDLLQRADQALNTAKRSGGGAVCMWRPGSGVEEAGNRDRLSGIFTGNMAKDYRHMILLWESVRVVAAGSGPSDLAASLLERLAHALRADRLEILLSGEGQVRPTLAGWVDGASAEPDRSVLPDERGRELVERSLADGKSCGAEHDERRSFAIPLIAREQVQGCLYVEGPSHSLGLDDGDLVFLDALGSQIGLALDQARLAHREKEQLRAEVEGLRSALHSSRLVYRSRAMQQLLELAKRVAASDATVLITGESGSGKEVMARTVHAMSARADQPLVIVDCGAISATLIDSELFGHEKGAFTGADGRKTGRLAEADGGTVLLDEIGELPLDVQSKLLRFAQEKQLTPVGSSRPRQCDVRILAATNVDLAERVTQGAFREDLFHRLNVVRLSIPPLRDRREDIVFLAEHFIRSYANAYAKPVVGLDQSASRALTSYDWPGNVRELQNRMMQAVLLSEGERLTIGDFPSLSSARGSSPQIDPEALPRAAAGESSGSSSELLLELRAALGAEIESAVGSGDGTPLPLGKWLTEDLILEAHQAGNEVARRGAAILGIAETTFRRRLRKARDQRQLGIAPRPNTWVRVKELLGRMVRASGWPAGMLLADVERVMLEESAARLSDDPRRCAAILGITEPTLRRRLA